MPLPGWSEESVSKPKFKLPSQAVNTPAPAVLKKVEGLIPEFLSVLSSVVGVNDQSLLSHGALPDLNAWNA